MLSRFSCLSDCIELSPGHALRLFLGDNIPITQSAWSLWRNRLARSAVNRKVGGSSPPRDEMSPFRMNLFFCKQSLFHFTNMKPIS